MNKKSRKYYWKDKHNNKKVGFLPMVDDIVKIPTLPHLRHSLVSLLKK